MRATVISLSLVIAALLVCCGQEVEKLAPADPNALLATYQGGSVTEEYLDSWITVNERSDFAALREDYLKEIVVTRVLGAEAIESGIMDSVEALMELRRWEAGEMQSALRTHLRAEVEVTDDEVVQAAKPLLQNLQIPRKLRLRNIFKAFQSNSPSEREGLRSEMEQLRQELVEGANFEEMATLHSESSNRYDGGLMGNIDPNRLDPMIENVAGQLGQGEVSPVLETDQGLSILLCEQFIPARERSADQVLARVRQQLEDRAFNQLWSELQATWKTFELETGTDSEVILKLWDGSALSAAETAVLLEHAGNDPGAVEPVALLLSADRYARQMQLHDNKNLQFAREWRRIQIASRRAMVSKMREHFVPASDEDVRIYYESNRSRFVTEPAVVVEAIALTSTPANRLAYIERMRSVHDLAIADSSVDFESLASRELAELPVRIGGRLGPLNANRVAALGTTVSRAIGKLSPGETSLVFTQWEGGGNLSVWLIKLVERIPPQPVDFVVVEEGIREHLNKQRTQEARSAAEREVLDAVGFTLNET